MYLRLLLVLSLLCSVGCTPHWKEPRGLADVASTDTVNVCINVSDSQYNAVAKAVDMWNKSLRAWKQFRPVKVDNYDSSCSFWVHETMMKHPKSDTAFAWASMIGGREIFLRKNAYEVDATGIMLHELGHALGAQHIDNTLMDKYWYPGMFVCPDAATVAQVAAYNGINLELLTWCMR